MSSNVTLTNQDHLATSNEEGAIAVYPTAIDKGFILCFELKLSKGIDVSLAVLTLNSGGIKMNDHTQFDVKGKVNLMTGKDEAGKKVFDSMLEEGDLVTVFFKGNEEPYLVIH